jgi:hypothetical protein
MAPRRKKAAPAVKGSACNRPGTSTAPPTPPETSTSFAIAVNWPATAEDIHAALDRLNHEERARFWEEAVVVQVLRRAHMAAASEAATARAIVTMLDEKVGELRRALATLPEHITPAMVALVEHLLRARSRKPDPLKAERNGNIIRLRTEDRRKWTYKRLARRFEMREEAVRKVCKRAGL